MRRTLLVLVAVAMLGTLGNAQAIRINEIGVGTQDYVEYINFSASQQTLTNWQVWFGRGAGYFGYLVPSSAILNANGGCMVWRDNGTGLPAYAAGTPAYLFTTQSLQWGVGLPGSCSILDSAGNGIDYCAFGNPTLENAPKSNGAAAVATNWTGGGVPIWGAVTGPNTGNLYFRHLRGDTDTPNDWSMTNNATYWAIPIGTAGPGPSYPNPFQIQTDADAMPPVAQFTASTTSGPSPLTVLFTNTSYGDCELSSLTWDFDSTANPGTFTSNLFNDSFIFTNPVGTPGGTIVNYDVTLTIVDTAGGMSTSAPTTIAVAEPVTALPQIVPYVEEFEGPMDPDTLTSMSPLNGWEVHRSSTNARVRTVDPRTVGAASGYVDATLSQPTAVVMDSAGAGINSRQEIVLHLDADLCFGLSSGDGFRIVVWARHSGEIPGFNDLICFQDGFTTGDAVDANGNVLTGTPGLDGFQEFLLADLITTIGPANTWARLEFTIDSNFFLNNGLLLPGGATPYSDCRFVIRHEADGTLAGGEGLIIDRVLLLDAVVTPPGWTGVPGFAVMDVNNAINVNDHFVGFTGDESGPHYTTIPGQGTMNMDILGELNQPILLLSGPLNPGVADYTSLPGGSLIGRFDVGGPLDPSGIPTSLVVLADGSTTQLPPTLFNLIWNTGADGDFSLSVALPPGIPAGFSVPMQAVVFRTGGVSLSNAVVLTIQ